MSRDEEQFLKLGREVVRMIRDVHSVPKGDVGYARRRFTFPGGEVHLMIANDARLADAMEAAAAKQYDVQDLTPPSARN